MRLKSISHKRLYLLLSFLVPCCVITMALIHLHITPFGNNTLLISDGDALYVNYLGYVARVVKGQEGLLYSFEKGLGGNMMGSWGWFLLNPFFVLFALVDLVHFPEMYTMVSTLNLSICGLTMYLFLKDIYGDKASNLIFSTSYALNGFLVANVFQMNFFIGVTMLPLVMLGLRKVLQNKSPVLYIVSLAYSILMNFYFGYMLCVASVFVFVSSLWLYKDILCDKKQILKKYAIGSFLAGLLSACVWLPACFSLKDGRLDRLFVDFFEMKENMPFIEIFMKMFSGTNNTSELVNGLPNIFTGILPVALLVLFLIDKKIEKRKKIQAMILMGIYLLTFYLPPLNYLMHGGTYTIWFNYRDSFVFSFFVLLVAAEEWQLLEEKSVSEYKRAAVILFVTVVIIFSEKYEFFVGGMLVLDFCFLGLIFLVFYVYKKNSMHFTRLSADILILILVCWNLCLNYEVCTYRILVWQSNQKDYVETVNSVYPLVKYVKAEDTSFYRMDVTKQRSGTTGNDPMLYGYYGVGHGGSDERDFVHQGLCKLGVHWYDLRNYYREGIPAATDSLLGIKYIVTREGEDLTEEKGYIMERKNLYRNPSVCSPVFLAGKDVENVQTTYEDVFENLNKTWSAVSGEDTAVFSEEEDVVFYLSDVMDSAGLSKKDAIKEKEKREDDNKSDSGTDCVSVRCEFTADRDGSIYVYNRLLLSEKSGTNIPALSYVGYYHKGEKVSCDVPVKSADDFSGKRSELADIAVNFKVAYADNEKLCQLVEKVNKRFVTVQKVSDCHLKGSFVAEENENLLFTVPYDKGWTLMIDGKKAEYKKVLDVFMAADVKPGKHEYEMIFVPEGLITGCKLSLFSLFFSMLYVLLDLCFAMKKSGR